MAILAAGSSEQELAFVCTLIVVNSYGLIFNLLIIYMFIRFRRRLLTNNKNLLLLSMSVADLCVGFTGIGGGVIFYFLKKGLTTVAVYKIGGLLPLFGSFFMSILSLGIMTADRIISVKFAIRHMSIMTRRRIKMSIVICWLIVFLLMMNQGLLFLFASAWIELQVRCLLLGIFFIVGSIVLSISNAILYITVGKRTIKRVTIRVQPSQTSQITNMKERQRFDVAKKREETRSARVCIWMTVLFIVCWLPLTIYYLVWLGLTANPLGRIGLTVCFALAGLNSVLNPVIYLLQRKDFRFYFRKMISEKYQAVRGQSNTISPSYYDFRETKT